MNRRYRGTGNRLVIRGIALACVVLLFAGALLLFPDILDADIGHKNQALSQLIPEDERSAFTESFSTGLPLIYISCEDIDALYPFWEWSPDGPAMPPREPSMSSVYVFNRAVNVLSDNATQQYSNVMIRLRGRTSSYVGEGAKRPFALEIQDSSGNTMDLPFLSLPADSDYVLHAPYIDKSCLRNYMAYTLAGELLDYTPRCQLVEVIINEAGTPVEADDYRGVYLLVEKIKAGTNRVPFKRFVSAPTLEQQLDYGGGYIVKIDAYEEGFDTSIQLPPTPNGTRYIIQSPKADKVTQDEVDKLYEELVFFEDVLYNGTYAELEQYFDLDSFVDFTLVILYCQKLEGFWGSTYFFRLPGGKFSAGPVWDYDIAFGNYYLDPWDIFLTYPSSFEEALLSFPEFRTRLCERWHALRGSGGTFSEEHVLAVFDDAVAYIGDDAFTRNTARYPNLFLPGFYNNVHDPENYVKELTIFRRYLIERGRWLDENIENIWPFEEWIVP